MLNRTQRRLLGVAAGCTVLLVALPPVEQSTKVVIKPFPMSAWGRISHRMEITTESRFIFRLQSEDQICWPVLIARTIFVWTIAAVALEVARRSRDTPS